MSQTRRTFLATLAAVPLAAVASPKLEWKSKMFIALPSFWKLGEIQRTLASRIIASIDRRRAFGYLSGVIYVSRAGQARLQAELGFDEREGILQLVGVPVATTVHCKDLGTGEAADFDYVICESEFVATSAQGRTVYLNDGAVVDIIDCG